MTAKHKAETIVMQLDNYLTACLRNNPNEKKAMRNMLILALEMALEEVARTQPIPDSETSA